MQGFLLAILVLTLIVPIGMSDAFGEITEATVTFVESHELTGSGGTPRYFDFNDDGTVLLIVEGATDYIEKYTLSTGYDLTTLSYAGNGQRFDSWKNNNNAWGDGQPRGMEFSNDGKTMFVIGNAGDEINQYELSASYDWSSENNSKKAFEKRINISALVGNGPHGIAFNADGTKVFLNNKDKIVKEFNTAGPFDIASLTLVQNINLSEYLTKGLRGLEFADDGKKFLVIEADCASTCYNVAKIHEFTLSTAYDVSSYTYEGEFDVLEWEQDAQGLGFNPDGTRMYVLGTNIGDSGDGDHKWNGTGEFIREFALSCPWQLTGTCGEEEEERSGACGFDRDCTAPRITNHGTSETPDGFSINDNVFEDNQERYNKNPTIQGTVGEPVTIKVRAWENMGTDRITLAIAYLAMHDEKPDWRDSTANIEFSIQQDEFKVYDKDKIFSAVGAITEKVEDPYGDNGALELLDITFTIIFAKPMEPSHIGIQTVDYITNYDLVYFENALEILPREIVEVEVSDAPEEIPEESSEPTEESEEFVPEPEPPIKDPEPEVTPAALTKKTVLEFVDENMPAKHYVKRYITETEYKEWFDVNYSDYKFWEGIGITQERFDQIVIEIESEPEPKMIQTGFVLVPDDQKSFPLVEETFEPEPVELEPVKEEKKGFFDWLFALFG